MNTKQERIAQEASDQRAWAGMGRHLARHTRRAMAIGLSGLALWGAAAHAQETICARVKIEIKQELTLERQAFDAQMKINNTTTTGAIENVSVVVKVTEQDGTPVTITDDPNNLNAKFFIRIASKENISNVDGTGTVNPNTTSVIDWLLIPAPGAAGNNPLGKKYLVGATLKYRFGGEDQVLEVSPDVITVKPLPLLTLDYFLTQNVWADDPLTPEIEPVEPFTLGVRVKNTGFATAKNLKIDSAQPKIIENNQGLLINFKLDGSYVNDAPAENTLLINFGDIAPATSKIGRWIMEATLAGKFTEFTAKFSHADELGGSLTSIMQATNAHFLIRDVRVDLPGRDFVRDFLAQDGDVIRVYESDGMDSVVTDRSGVAQLTAGVNAAGNATYQLVIPATSGFIYVKLPDPFKGQKALGQIVRSDAKAMLPENVWLSKTRNEQSKQWEYWINFFDVNTPGSYAAEFNAPPTAAQAPVIQFIPDRVVKEGKQVSFLVEASSPNGKPVTLSAAPLPAGATMSPQPVQSGLANSIFDWTPAKGQAGNYLITYTATDGQLSSTKSASIKVEADAPPPGPIAPAVVAPLGDAKVTSLKPSLIVQTSGNTQDPTTQVQFEIYADSAMTQLIDSAVVNKGVTTGDAGTTSFTPAKDLNDNTHYWWRARAFDGGQLYSLWVDGRFFVNLFNDPPGPFNATSPASQAEVGTLLPSFSWTNSVDADGDALSYSIAIYKDTALTELVARAADLPQDPSGATSWTAVAPLANHVQYYWRVTATDALGAQTSTAVRPFTINTGNTAPSIPAIAGPAAGSQVSAPGVALTIQNSADAEGDLITYVFEIDTVSTFDSSNKRSSGQVIQGTGATTSWTVTGLAEDKRYWWRVKAQDGRAESGWVVADFLMNAVNAAPSMPTVKNPGNGAWVATQQPMLEVNPSQDPEGDAIRYQFEVYRDASLSERVADGTSGGASWVVPMPLADKTTYRWRVRAKDAFDAASDWSPANVMYVSTGPYQDPTIQVTAPATPVVPAIVGTRKFATIRWTGSDPNIEPAIALYWSASDSGYAGSLIVDGLRQAAGTQSGSYDWDVTDLAPGAYYVYAVIYDSKGMGRAYASGAVVVPAAAQTGSIVVTGNNLATSESGTQQSFTVRLGSAPTGDVTIPITSTNMLEGMPSPSQLVFTRANWGTNQAVTVTGQVNCAPNDSTRAYQILVGKAVSLDPNYIGLAGPPVDATNADDGDKSGTTNSPDIHICGYTLVSQQQVTSTLWDYTFSVAFTNTGANALAVKATLGGKPTGTTIGNGQPSLPTGTTIVDGQSSVGAIGTRETIRSMDTVTIRTNKQSSPEVLVQTYMTWTVVIQH